MADDGSENMEEVGNDSFKQKLARFKKRESTTLQTGENVPYIARIGAKTGSIRKLRSNMAQENMSLRGRRTSGHIPEEGDMEGSFSALDIEGLDNSRGSVHDRVSAYNTSISKLTAHAVISPRYSQRKTADGSSMLQASFRHDLDDSTSSLGNFGTGTAARNRKIGEGSQNELDDSMSKSFHSSHDKASEGPQAGPGTPPDSPRVNGSGSSPPTRRATIMDRISMYDAMSPSGFQKGRTIGGLGMLSPRLMKKKKESSGSLADAVGAMPLDDDEEGEIKSKTPRRKSSRTKSIEKKEKKDITSPKRVSKPYEISLGEPSNKDSDHTDKKEISPKRISKPYEIDIDRTQKPASEPDEIGTSPKRISKPYEIDIDRTQKPASGPDETSTTQKRISKPYEIETAPKRVSKPYEIETESTPKRVSKPYEIETAPKRVSKPYEIETESTPKRVSKPYEIESTPKRVSKPYEIETESAPKRVSKPYEIETEASSPRKSAATLEIQAGISVKRSSKPYEISTLKEEEQAPRRVSKPYEIDRPNNNEESSGQTPKRVSKPYEINSGGESRETPKRENSSNSAPKRSESIIKDSAPSLEPENTTSRPQSKLKKLASKNAATKKALPPSGLRKRDSETVMPQNNLAETIQESVQRLKPARGPARGDEDPEDRRNRLKATKSDLHDQRRTLKRNQSGIARKTDNEEVRAPVWAKKLHTFVPPVFPKDPSEENLIRKALRRNFVFDGLEDAELETFVAAFEEINLSKGSIVFKHGEKGDYFYIVKKGKVKMGAKGVMIGTASEGMGFGELSLLYTCPRAASAVAVSEPTKLFRVDQRTFRVLMKKQTEELEEIKRKLLKGISFLKDVNDSDIFRLSNVMIPHRFDTGDIIVKKGEPGDAFYILQDGQVRVTDISYGDAKYEDVELGPGDYFGERALATTEPRAANVVALSEGLAFSIDGRIFERCVGNLTQIIQRAQDKQKLEGIKLLRDAQLTSDDFDKLTSFLEEQYYFATKKIFREGQEHPAGLYLVREGDVKISSADGSRSETVGQGGFFGQEALLADAKGLIGADGKMIPTYTATAGGGQRCVLGFLRLSDCRSIFDTKTLGHEVFNGPCPEIMEAREELRKIVKANVALEDLERESVLGEGLFGEVWLVRADIHKTGDPDKKNIFALKIQTTDTSVRADATEAIKREMSVLSQLKHPFVVDLVNTYQDDDNIYMLMNVIRGGELWSVIHKEGEDGEWTSGMPEEQAKFYALVIADTLTSIHRQNVVYRDLKPENVLIDEEGYPILVDFGFAKHCPDKTHTFCGTPNYLAPEIVMNRGHTFGCDHWALGIVIYEMLAGENPFFFDGMDQMALFEAIVREEMYPLSDETSQEAFDIVDGLLQKDPKDRLGMLAGREKDLLTHKWFDGLDLTTMRSKKLPAPWVPSEDELAG